MGRVYEPAEDSLLLLRNVERLVRGSVLDMGTGSGVQAVAAAAKPEVVRVVAVDIDPCAVEAARRRAVDAGVLDKVEFSVGDLFERLGGERFDWIVFNPPYLPSEGAADEPSWAGGRRGGEVVDEFLSRAAEHLKPGGGILLVISTLTGLDHGFVERNYQIDLLEELPLFFEKLSCLLLRPKNPPARMGSNRAYARNPPLERFEIPLRRPSAQPRVT